MRNFVRLIRDKIFGIEKLSFLLKSQTNKQIQLADYNKRELKAFEILKPYFPEGYLLETSYSLSFQAIQHILNDILIYKPRFILEFGSGLSTIVIGNFIKSNDMNIKLISIDDDLSWQEFLKEMGAIADFYNFPLIDNHPHSYNGKGKWFEIPDDHLISEFKFDLVIVDAPKGALGKFSRYGFIGFVRNRLSDQTIIYLDDTHRPDENKIGQCFLSEIGVPMIHEKYFNYSRFSSNQSFNTSPS